MERHGVSASDRYMHGFARLFRLLRDQSLAGQERPEFRQAVRSLSCRPYRLLYQIDGNTVVIDRIIHQARDVRSAMRSEP